MHIFKYVKFFFRKFQVLWYFLALTLKGALWDFDAG